MNLWRYFKFHFYKFKRLQGSPHALAGGTAIGVFIGLTPTMPFHTLLIVFLTLASRTSTLAGIIVSWIVCNPLTYLPIYYLSTLIGNHITPYELNLNYVQDILKQVTQGADIKNSLGVVIGSGYQALVVLGIGGLIFALPFAIISYYLSRRFFMQIQQRRMKRHILS